MQTIVLYLCYIVWILLFSSAYHTCLIYCFVIWCLHTNKRRPCSSTLSGHPSSSFCFKFLAQGTTSAPFESPHAHPEPGRKWVSCAHTKGLWNCTRTGHPIQSAEAWLLEPCTFMSVRRLMTSFLTAMERTLFLALPSHHDQPVTRHLAYSWSVAGFLFSSMWQRPTTGLAPSI